MPALAAPPGLPARLYLLGCAATRRKEQSAQQLDSSRNLVTESLNMLGWLQVDIHKQKKE